MSEHRWYCWVLDRWDAIRSSYWFIPVLMAAATAAAASLLLESDRRGVLALLLGVSWSEHLDPAGARIFLSTVAGSMITVTGVVFSVTIVALTLASSQFGPRLLRTFLRDRASQLCLGTFLSTFLYSLLVLRAVRGPEDVPVLATAGAAALAVASLFVLIYFIHHAANSIQASHVVGAVAGEINAQVEVLFPDMLGQTDPDLASPETDRARVEALQRDAAVVAARCDGYVRVIDGASLLGVAREFDLCIEIGARPGCFVARGDPLVRVAPAGRADEEVAERVRGCVALGDERTPVQDFGFLLDQLSAMAERALSPGINDPDTAVACVHRLGAALSRVAERADPSEYQFDEDGVLRVVAKPSDFDTVAAACLDSVRRAGAATPEVAEALLHAIASAARHSRSPQRLPTLAGHAQEVLEAFQNANPTSKRDIARVEEAFASTQNAIGTRPALLAQ